MTKRNGTTFDQRLIASMLNVEVTDITEEQREEAWRKFKEKLDGEKIAANSTMRKWFGLGGNAKLPREQAFQLCFELGYERTQAEYFLKSVLLEPGLQVNDYREMIYMYGFDHSYTYEMCQKMIVFYEERLERELVIENTKNTNELREQYESMKGVGQDDFMLWMSDRAGMFKGYSKSAFEYYLRCKKEIIDAVREEAKVHLDRFLAESDYENWVSGKRSGKRSEKDLIVRYIYLDQKKRDGKLTQSLAQSILELNQIANSNSGENALLISEVFSKYIPLEKQASFGSGMTNKRLSDILNIAIKKEQEIRATQALCSLRMMELDELCPKDIGELVVEYSKEKKKAYTVGDAVDWFEKFLKDIKYRQVIVQRGDLLPLVLHIAQRRYLKEINWEEGQYSQEEACALFVEFANDALVACCMEPLSEQYELDALLLRCFEEHDMCSYADALEKWM